MLAQNFKTATDLGITEIEIESLIKVLGMLERGELNHAPSGEDPGFNMGAPHIQLSCGTVGCIAGWARYISGGEAFPWANRASAFQIGGNSINELFVPSNYVAYLSRIRPDQAAIALRNFLTFGEPRWEEALQAN